MTGSLHARDQRLAILGYHKLGDPPQGGWESWYYVPERIFVEQLTYLKRNDWQVIDLATLLIGLAAPDRLPSRAAVLTFDDGYRSLLTVGLPHLLEFQYSGVVFVPTRFIAGSNLFDLDEEPPEMICDWDDLRALESGGVSVQSHGVTHRRLSALDPAEQRAELIDSKVVLEEALGKPVEVFAYPYGDGGTGRFWRVQRRRIRDELQAAGYQAACLYGGGQVELPCSDWFRLERVAIGPDSDLEMELGSCSLN